ncbi:MAG: glycosyltransferase [candidate division WOR-3 bacterium]
MELINKKLLVSVIINTYNYGRFIEDAIDSVLNQDFPKNEMEVIVVDDGSTDDTPERVKKYKDKIKYIYKENEGQASAINVGIENSNGEYIVLLDSDDYFHPEKIKKVVEEFERYKDVVYVSNGCIRVNEKGERIDESKSFSIHNVNLTLKNIHIVRKMMASPSKISFRISSLKKILPIPENLKYAADIYLNGSIMWFGNLSHLNDKLTYVRFHGENVNRKYKKNKDLLISHINAMKRAFFYIKKNAKKSEIYDPFIFKEVNLPLKIEIMEKELYLSLILNKARRKDLIKLEIEKFKLNKDFPFYYKIYKILTAPFFFLPPKLYFNFKNFYSEKKLFKIRKIVLPY